MERIIEIINNRKTIINNKDEPIYLYDPSSNVLIHRGTTGTSTTYGLPENYSFSVPPDDNHKKIIIYDNSNDSWYSIAEYFYVIDDNGFFIEKLPNPLHIDKLPKNTEISPPSSFIKPRFDGTIWKDCPIPSGMYAPKWNLLNSVWEETLSNLNINLRIDVETDSLIKEWCVSQGKNEEYYINKGISNGPTDPNYISYSEAKTRIIVSQNLKKKVLQIFLSIFYYSFYSLLEIKI